MPVDCCQALISTDTLVPWIRSGTAFKSVKSWGDEGDVCGVCNPEPQVRRPSAFSLIQLNYVNRELQRDTLISAKASLGNSHVPVKLLLLNTLSSRSFSSILFKETCFLSSATARIVSYGWKSNNDAIQLVSVQDRTLTYCQIKSFYFFPIPVRQWLTSSTQA